MNLTDQIWNHYLEQPRTDGKLVTVNKALKNRLRRYRTVRDTRLAQIRE